MKTQIQGLSKTDRVFKNFQRLAWSQSPLYIPSLVLLRLLYFIHFGK